LGQFELGIVIPAYNEGNTIEKIVVEAIKFGMVIVVDDCSSDNTFMVSEKAGAIVLRQDANLGYEEAINMGLKYAFKVGCSHVITMDADGEHSSECLKDFCSAFKNENYDLIIGVRKKTQRLAEALIGKFTNFIYGVEDIYCGMKGYSYGLWASYGSFDYNKSAGIELSMFALKRKFKFKTLNVYGIKRVDAPRYGVGIRLNFRMIFKFIKVLAS
jgi:glycosyltransferase involved in cell wall biosynthesis